MSESEELETVNIDLRVFEEGNKKKSSFQLKGVQKFENVAKLKEFLVANYPHELQVDDASELELGYFGKPGYKKFHITNELHLAEAYSLEKKSWLSLWSCKNSAKRKLSSSQQPNKRAKLTVNLDDDESESLLEKKLNSLREKHPDYYDFKLRV
ncbi:hypothetical protein AC249_AIPGENE3710 [Exaiptasia diaphana]|nr:hypothetical protein AC249_AIPGENE3710 [Exaiptasia diaphana]